MNKNKIKQEVKKVKHVEKATITEKGDGLELAVEYNVSFTTDDEFNPMTTIDKITEVIAKLDNIGLVYYMNNNTLMPRFRIYDESYKVVEPIVEKQKLLGNF